MENSPAMKKLEAMILECSRLDREINCFVESVDEITGQVCLNCLSLVCHFDTKSLSSLPLSHPGFLSFFF